MRRANNEQEGIDLEGGADVKSEITSETIKAAPPVGLMALAHFSNWTLNDVVLAITGVYVLAQLVYLFWKWRREAKKHGRR